MKREPSLHITEDNLRFLLREFYDHDENAESDIDEIVDFLMTKGVKLALEKRTITLTNEKMIHKVETKTTNDKTDISLLSQIIFTIRQSLKHRGIKPIDKDSPEWAQLKKLTPIINNFCNDFNLEKRQGYIEYVKIGIGRITSLRGYITKLYDMSEVISLEYEVINKINLDPYKSWTREIHDYYVNTIDMRTGIRESYVDNPTMYYHFVEICKKVKELKLDYRLYIDAQFEGLKWTGGYPDPAQLVSDKAMQRLNKHLFTLKKENKVGDKPNKDLKNVLKNIKNGKDNN